MKLTPAAGSAARNQYGTFQVHHASPAQVKYIKNLAAGRVLPEPVPAEFAAEVEAMREGTINKKAASRLIDWLLTLPHTRKTDGSARVTGNAGDRSFNPEWRLSPKQFDLIRKVAGEKPHWPTHVEAAQDEADTIATVLDPAVTAEIVEVTKRDASKAIDFLFAVPRAERRAAGGAEPEVGMYRDGDTIYRVYLGQQSGRNLVKRVVKTGGTWIDSRGEIRDEYEYEYVGQASRVLPDSAVRMDLEEAKVWGRMTASCCVCAARLDNPESVDAGIGPVCGRKFA